MAIDNWERIQDLFHAAADMAPDEQRRFLDSACPNDATRREVESLLVRDRAALASLPLLVETTAQDLLGADPLIGTRIGPWRIVRAIGRGGMGAVYLAARDDDQYHKEAALKLVKYGMDTAELLMRFRHERQILANLDHPYIARLIDGGNTPEGRPFLVMEYVAGQPIDQWCRDRNLSLEDRCRLMLKVCEPVAFAHRNLVVHRDLKPGNIFITADGTPKLLDFGVAKLLTPELPGDATVTQYAGRAMTPDYASPEQVKGTPVTTATDVYSLGAILYELLAGCRAHHVTSTEYGEVERAICETPVRPPSESVDGVRLRRQLAGDLDNIVLTAMRKEPERRYSSVEQLADDIRRHLDGRPVAARPDAWGYRAGKFLGRNRLVLSAAGLVAVSLFVGAVVAVSEARQAVSERRAALAALDIARREHSAAAEQRDAAVEAGARAESEAGRARTEKQRAEQRLREMVALANHSLFEIHSRIEHLPGATEARRQLVKTTLDYLEQVSKDAANDQSLRLALAAAYLKLGMVQGNPYGPSLGDLAGAMKSFRTGAALLESVRASQPQNVEARQLWLELQSAIGSSLATVGEAAASLKIFTAALSEAQALYRQRPDDPKAGDNVGTLYGELSSVYTRDDDRIALKYARQSLVVFDALAHRFPDRGDVLEGLSSAHSRVASAYASVGDLESAVRESQETANIVERQVLDSPDDASLLRGLMLAYGHLGDRLGVPFVPNQGKYEEARAEYRKVVALAERLAQADHSNRNAQYDLASALMRMGSIPAHADALPEALQAEVRASEILEAVAKGGPEDQRYAKSLALAQEYCGHRLRELGRLSEALAAYRKSLATILPLKANSASDRSVISQQMASERGITAALAEMKDREGALSQAQATIAEAQEALAAAPGELFHRQYLALAWVALGNARLTLGQGEEDWRAASAAADHALAQMRTIPNGAGNRSFAEGWQLTQKLLADCATHEPR